MSLISRISAELAEPDAPARKTWYVFQQLASVLDASGTIRTCAYVPRTGIEARLITARSSGLCAAAVGNRYYNVGLEERVGNPSAPSAFYRAYFPAHITAGQGIVMNTTTTGQAERWSVTALPIVGCTLPIPDLWMTDEFRWVWNLGNIPVGAADTLATWICVQERNLS